MRTWYHWDFRTDPEAPLSWPDPEKRIVLCDYVEGDIGGVLGEAGVFIAVSDALARGVAVVFPAALREPHGARLRATLAADGAIPALLVRRQADLAGVDALLSVKARHRALLAEPEEELDLLAYVDVPPGRFYKYGTKETVTRIRCLGAIDLVIVRGREKPVHPDWVRSLRDQCKAAGVAFHFAGWGAYVPDDHAPLQVNGHAKRLREWMAGGFVGPMPQPVPPEEEWWTDGGIAEWGSMGEDGRYWENFTPFSNEMSFYRVGPERSERMLDGREWLETPEGI